MLTPETALEKREFMLREGYVLLENILPDAFLEELRAETEGLIAGHVEAPELRFQGQHIDVQAVDNAIIDKLLTWKPAFEALAALGFGDFSPEAKSLFSPRKRAGRPSTGIRTGSSGMIPSACRPGRRLSPSTII